MAVEREVTQAKLTKLSAGTLQHTPGQEYTVADRLEERAAAAPDRPFLFFGERTQSYGELNAEANRMAHAARSLGLAQGDVVALMMENRPEFVSTWMGLAKLGVVTSLVNTNLKDRALRHVLEVSHARFLVVGSECLPALAHLDRKETGGWKLLVRRDAEFPGEPASQEEDLDALLARMDTGNPDPSVRSGLLAGEDLFQIFTSGTTGLPKAARLSHMRFLGVGDGMSAIAGYGPDDVIACVLPLYHGAAGMVVVSCALSHGAAIALRRRFSARAFWSDARRTGTTAFQYIGEICRYLLNQLPGPGDRDHMIRVMMGAGLGADIWTEFQERFGIESILEGWSSTEANTSLINLDGVPGSCGRIPFPELHNGRLIRFDVETETHPRSAEGFLIECDADEVGEFIGMIPDLPDSGAGRFEGYTSEEATEAKILRDVFQKGDRWYRSGDLLRCDSEGYFSFVDRIGDTYRWMSENVSTQEVAEILSGFPGLAIANVFGVQVPGTEGRAGMAALAMREGVDLDGRALYAFVADRLPRYAAPVFVRIVTAADMTSTFKLRKIDLQRDGYDPARVGDPLLVADPDSKAYLALTPESLARNGLAPFA